MATIPYVGWVIGGGLIIFDVVSNKEGVIPAIIRQLKSPLHKAEIRAKLTEEIVMQFEMASPRISLAVADETYRSYIKFIENWRIVVGWSENSETFKRLLQIVETRDLPRIASLMEALTVIKDARGDLSVDLQRRFLRNCCICRTQRQIFWR